MPDGNRYALLYSYFTHLWNAVRDMPDLSCANSTNRVHNYKAVKLYPTHAFDYAILKEEWMPTIIETWYDEMEPAWGFTIQIFELLPPNRPPKKRESFNKH